MSTTSTSEFIELKGNRIKRRQLLVRYIRERAGYKCQACGFTFTKKDGSKYVEVAHLEPLAKSRLDTIENAAALCPNCHKKLDFGDKDTRNEVLVALGKLKQPS